VSGYELTPARVRADLKALAAGDEQVAAAAAAVGELRSRRMPPTFASLVRISVGQQLSTRAAASIYARLEKALGGSVTAKALLAATDDSLRESGVSEAKRSHLRDAASAVQGGLDLAGLAHADDAGARAAVESLRGFGPWSADIFLMFALGRADIWPVGDLAVRAGFAAIKGLDARPSPKDLRALGEPYRPRRSVLALLCWQHYLDVSPV